MITIVPCCKSFLVFGVWSLVAMEEVQVGRVKVVIDRQGGGVILKTLFGGGGHFHLRQK
jgi:hypothetical protein